MHLMIDLETAGADPDCAILQIGAVYFDGAGNLGKDFICNVDLQSCLDEGMTVTAATLQWWIAAGPGAVKAAWKMGALPIGEALEWFKCWIYERPPPETVWANGAAFDASVLQSAYRRVEKRIAPWEYHRTMDLRTLLYMAGKERCEALVTRAGTAHNALDDCKHQVRLWRAAMRILGQPTLPPHSQDTLD